MYATCFDLSLGHPQARQYKNHTKEAKINFEWGPFYSHYFYNFKTYNMQYKGRRNT
jgi:hypothetical protein